MHRWIVKYSNRAVDAGNIQLMYLLSCILSTRVSVCVYSTVANISAMDILKNANISCEHIIMLFTNVSSHNKFPLYI